MSNQLMTGNIGKLINGILKKILISDNVYLGITCQLFLSSYEVERGGYV
jgi:hypothetical protein